MSIRYDDIRKQKTKLDEKYQRRWKLLQDLGYKLTSEFRGSLSLPSQTWFDNAGNEMPYVSIGIINEHGKFQKMPLASINLDDGLALNFKISTVIDDALLSGVPFHILTISMWCGNSTLIVDLASGKKKLLVSEPYDDLAFSEVCAAMKEIILSSVTDTRLEYEFESVSGLTSFT